MPAPARLIDAIRQPAFLYGPDGMIAEANDLAVALVGRPIAGMTPAEVFALFSARRPDGVPPPAGELPAVRALSGDEVVDYPLAITSPDGREMHVLVTASPVRDGDWIAGALSIWQDITERVRAEEALREGEERFQSILESISDSFLALDRDWRFTYVNRRAISIGGRKPGEVIGRRIWEVFPEIVGTPLETFYRTAMERREPMVFENRSTVVVGQIFELHAYPLDDGLSIFGQEITERKRAETALRESEAKYRTLFDSIDEGFFIIDVLFDEHDRPVDLHYVEANAAATRMLGQDWTGKRLTELSPDYEQYWFEIFGGVARTGESVRLERYAAPDRRWYSFYVFRVGGPESRRIGNTFIDITDRKRAEEAIRASQARLVEAQRLAKVGNWEWDVPMDDVVWSRETYAIFGRDPDLPAPGFRDNQSRYYAPESWARLNEAVKGAIEAGEPYDLEVEVIREDGDHRWLVARGEAVRDAGGALTKLRGTVQDITERRRAAAQLERNKALLARVLELSMDGIYRRDLVTGRYEYANPALASITGYSLDELMRMDLDAVIESIHPDDRAVVRKVGETPGSWSGMAEYRFRCRDGAFRWISEHFTVEAGDDGRPRFITGVVRDVTSRRENEEALRRYADDLARSNEDLERFAYVSSHDLQEPLRSIVSFSQLLERRYKGKLDSDADEYIDFIVEGGNRMQTLILDLLAYSRVNSTAQELRPTDVEAVMAAAERHIDGQLREAGAVLTHDPLPVVVADPLQLEQVFSNLVSNAIKFRRPDVPLRIHVGARRLDGFWEFSVQDNGIGIEPDYYDQIFVIFKRLHTKDAYPGTGIGLAIVKRIVERHGGRIWVASTPGEGSTFYFTLPAA